MEKYKITYTQKNSTEKTVIYEYSDEYSNMGATVIQDFLSKNDITNIILLRMERVE